MATGYADAPPKGVRGLVTVAHVLPARPGAPGTCRARMNPPCPVAGVVLAVTLQAETYLHN